MKTNTTRRRLVSSLCKHSKKTKQKLWKDVSARMSGSRKNRAEVNIGEIERSSTEGSVVVVPGKVLGEGDISHKVTVAAYSFSNGARSKINASGGACFSLTDFMEKAENSKGVILLG